MATPFHSLLGRILCACLAALAHTAATAQPQDSPAASHPFAQSRPIAGRYIVVFKDSVANPAAEAADAMRGSGGQLHYTYSAAIKGFAATLPDAAVQAIRNNPAVDYVEQDQTVSLSEVEYSATWGLDRIDQRDLPLSSTYLFNYTGLDVHAFIIDTGIRADHDDFTGRVLAGYNTVSSDETDTNDCNGHGTHVAGTVGGTTWGVAKKVSITPVRVLNCRGSGTYSGVIAGIDYVAGSDRRPAVANMSLGGGKSTSMNDAVAGAVNSGVTMVVAAGNSSADACNYSPASEPSAITVGATTSSDTRASYSNYGACVDIFAPGSSITSAWYTTRTATNTISGTSMASPHVAGVAALVAQANLTNPETSPAAIASFITSKASIGKLFSVGTGSPNLLLYSLGEGNATDPLPTLIGVTAIVGSSGKSGRNWRAYATVTIRDVSKENGPVMANVTVTGSFLPPGSSASCVTTGSGSCKLTSAPIGTNNDFTMFTIGNVSGPNMTWNGATSTTPIYKP